MTPIEQYRALLTILYKEIHRFMRIWTQTLIPPAIMIMLYFVIFGTLIGKRIGEMGGFDYMQFMIPGLIMMSVISNSYSNVVSSFFGQKFARSIEELLIPTISYVHQFHVLKKLHCYGLYCPKFYRQLYDLRK